MGAFISFSFCVLVYGVFVLIPVYKAPNLTGGVATGGKNPWDLYISIHTFEKTRKEMNPTHRSASLSL